MSKLNAKISSERIRSIINSKCGGSQQVFADACGVSKNSVSQWVNGVSAPGNYSAVKISRVYGVDPLWVVGEPDAPMYKTNVTQSAMMTEHEETMFHRYRSLPPHYRKLVDDMIQTLAASCSATEAVLLNDQKVNDHED